MHLLSESSSVEYLCDLCTSESPDVLLISGCTGSGKSRLSNLLSQKIPASQLSLDDYFKDESEMEIVIPDLNIRQWDSPDCYRWDLLVCNLQSIFNDKIAKIPIFSHEQSKQIGWKFARINNRPLIIEGIYSMRPEVVSVLQAMRLKFFSVFLDIPAETRWQRKYDRDVLERGENPETLRLWFNKVILPAEEKWIQQQAINADINIVEI